MTDIRTRIKRRLLRYRKAAHGYALYMIMTALFLLLAPLIIYEIFGFAAHFYVILTSLAVMSTMAAIYLIFTKREIIDRFGWFMLIILVPFFGAFLFCFVGISQMRPHIYKEKNKKDLPYIKREQTTYLQEIPEKLSRVAALAPESVFLTGTKNEFLTGQAVYDAMLVDILNAKHHIHLEMYIIRYDKTTKDIFEALIDKARAGVEVRFLADVFGTIFLKDKKLEELIDAGVEVAFFNQTTRQYLDNFHVNHRKNLIIDGLVAYTGGFNLGNEYVDGYPKKKLLWYDTMVRIEGNVVEAIQSMFLLDWVFSLDVELPYYMDNPAYFPQVKAKESDGTITQFISDGPDRDGAPVKDVLRHLILTAKHRIYFTTPYLIPSDDLLMDLKFAVHAGVDVRIIIPAVPDKKVVYKSTESHIEELLAAGVRIYKMDAHFIHSKLFVFDDDISMYGTVNFDMRSFYLNFEENIIQYDDKTTNQQISLIIDELFGRSTEIDHSEWRKRSVFRKIYERAVRFLKPLF